MMTFNSFHSFNYAKPDNLGNYIGLENYRQALRDEAFFGSIKRLIIFIIITLSAETVFGIILAHILRDVKNSRPLLSIFLMPTVSAPVVVGLMGKFLLNTSFGQIAYMIDLVLGVNLNILSDPKLAFLALAAVEIWHWTPLLALIFYSGLIALPKDPFDAAKVDGASSWTEFYFITLPMMMPIIVAGVMIRGIDLFKIFDEILVMTGGGPGNATELFNYFLYKLAFRSWNVGQASAIGVLTICIMIPFAYILYKMVGGGKSE